ncbi:Uncharacterized protein TCAP_06481 [Tolypocladium capitatum]|uniref:RRM domain-containing protein n=1 Tax=Tolypocladium capitatum TaxID=45235 RepID=A0A2K3Q7L4_9HYPO|nr:Uncharacterized protein TCAP_06481 [Tolypocladium capitatum]
MAEADFEIDFYGDAGNDEHQHQHRHRQDSHQENDNDYREHDEDYVKSEQGDGHRDRANATEDTTSRQGTKRKSEEDDRPVDPGATAAIMISELCWWTTDDDIRGWLRKAECEVEVRELTFSEHKVNGKSKGQAYVEFQSRQGATAAKHFIDQAAGEGTPPAQKKMTTSYWNPGMNPFRTLPKDAPARVKEQPRSAPSGPYNDRGGYGGGFRGRGGFSGGRGGMNQNTFNNNRNFNNNLGFNNNMGGGGGGFNGPMGGGNFGFNGGRGGMMGGGMRGGPGGMRGGRGGNMMGMGPMGGMPMGMPGNMGMMGMGGMPGFQGMNPNFNAGGFGFGQNQGGGGNGDWGNPHGAKRPRPE